jgi:ubiquinol-cytochrome c reductase subunit 6
MSENWAGCAIKKSLEEKAHPKCLKKWAEYEACTQRIKNDTTGEAQCSGQYFEYWHCVDALVLPPSLLILLASAPIFFKFAPTFIFRGAMI